MTKKRQMGWKGGRKKKDGGVSHPLQKSGARGGEAEGQRQQRAWSMEHGGRSVERQHGARSMERQHGAWSIEHRARSVKRRRKTEARVKGGGTW
jgi:hypothetical protein